MYQNKLIPDLVPLSSVIEVGPPPMRAVIGRRSARIVSQITHMARRAWLNRAGVHHQLLPLLLRLLCNPPFAVLSWHDEWRMEPRMTTTHVKVKVKVRCVAREVKEGVTVLPDQQEGWKK